jgi:hypothetical protein
MDKETKIKENMDAAMKNIRRKQLSGRDILSIVQFQLRKYNDMSEEEAAIIAVYQMHFN